MAQRGTEPRCSSRQNMNQTITLEHLKLVGFPSNEILTNWLAKFKVQT
jgi:hypothetical protein